MTKTKGDIIGEEELILRVNAAVMDIILNDVAGTIALHNFVCQGQITVYEDEAGDPLDAGGRVIAESDNSAYIFTESEFVPEKVNKMAADIRLIWKYKDCTIVPIACNGSKEAEEIEIDFGFGPRSRYWRIDFPDETYIHAPTKAECRTYIDRVIEHHQKDQADLMRGFHHPEEGLTQSKCV